MGHVTHDENPFSGSGIPMEGVDKKMSFMQTLWQPTVDSDPLQRKSLCIH